MRREKVLHALNFDKNEAGQEASVHDMLNLSSVGKANLIDTDKFSAMATIEETKGTAERYNERLFRTEDTQVSYSQKLRH